MYTVACAIGSVLCTSTVQPSGNTFCPARYDRSSQLSRNDWSAAAHPSFAREWHATWQLSHKAHNKLMHIMHGNGSTAEKPVVTVQRELGNLLGELERNGQVQQWSELHSSAQLAQPLRQLWADVQVCRAQMASASSSEATETAALRLLVTQALAELAGRADVKFFSALWTASRPPFHFFLTHAWRNALGHVVQATCHKLSEALAQIDPPSVTAANRALSAMTDGPTSPPDDAIFVWRGMESVLQLERFRQEVQSGGCPIAFSLSPDGARSFGKVVVRVLVPERMISCFAKLPKAHAHEAAVVLLHRPCSLLDATDSSPWANRCYRLAEPMLPPQAGPPAEASGGAATSSGGAGVRQPVDSGGAGVRQPVEAPRAQAHFAPAGDVAGVAKSFVSATPATSLAIGKVRMLAIGKVRTVYD